KAKARKDDAVLYSMDDTALFGEEFHRLSFSKAIDKKLLSDYKVIIVAVDEAQMEGAVAAQFTSELKKSLDRKQDEEIIEGEKVEATEASGKGPAVKINKQIAAELLGTWKALSGIDIVDILASGAQVKQTSDDAVKPMKSAVAFSNTIKESESICASFDVIQKYFINNHPKDFNRFVNVKAEHIDGRMNDKHRRKQLQWLTDISGGASSKTDAVGGKKTNANTGANAGAGSHTGLTARTNTGAGAGGKKHGCKILSNARCLSEGVDVPSLDAVVFFKERKSIVDVVQAVGRVMRKVKGKDFGYIILPVCIPSGEVHDYENFINNHKVFDRIWGVVKALRAHDNRFVSEAFFRDRVKVVPGPVITHAGGGGGGGSAGGPATVQGQLPFPLKDISDAIYAAIPTKLGDKDYWRRWTTEVANIADKIAGHLNKIFAEGENKKLFEDFLESLRSNLNPTVSAKDAVDMLAQHIITRPVFEMLFSGESFVKRNPVARALQTLIDSLDTAKFAEQTAKLKGFYDSVKERVESCANDDKAKQEIIRHLYDTFFKEGFPLMAERLGIAYTPIEVVDFVLRSTAHVLQEEFGRQLGDKDVHIVDPFTGTGSFIVRMLQIKELIEDGQLKHKFRHEIHANEILLLPYYVALTNIVTAYHDRLPAGSEYEPFPGMVLTDSFQLYEDSQPSFTDDSFSPDNSERAKRQRKTPINIVIGNPPWSAGQRSDNDNNQNLEYPNLDARIKATYAKESTSQRKAALYDSYIRAIRWSSDRIGEDGIIALVTNGGWLNGNAASGLRASLVKEFDSIRVVNLRGDARTSGETWHKEGGKIFGQASRAPVTLIILVKNPNNRRKNANIFYHDIGNYLSAEGKLDILSNKRSIAGLNFQTITPDKDNDWINQRDRRFDKFIEIGNKQVKSGELGFGPTVFKLYSGGVKTNRDYWAYNFSRVELAENMRRMINFYNLQVELYQNRAEEGLENTADLINNDPGSISWDGELRGLLTKKRLGKFSLDKVRLSLYRPFSY
ncbi:MAG: N-6 DNA methylase, partial [Proteobacteria bacterium]|nr:N-6 DNA methylase [Pseudomonadota bacterium]